MFTASEVETATLAAGINPGVAGLLGGMTGGIAQAYATMGECYSCYHLNPRLSLHHVEVDVSNDLGNIQPNKTILTLLHRFHDMYENC